MLYDLLKKETTSLNNDIYKHKYQKYLMWLVKAIFVALFIAAESYIFLALNSKINEYSSYGILIS